MRGLKYQHIAVDFDGTLAAGPVNWPEPGRQLWLHKLILKWVKWQQKKGAFIILNTLRKDENLETAKKWLADRDFVPDAFNENNPGLIEQWGDSRKIAADIYIDDRNIGLFGWYLRKLSKGHI